MAFAALANGRILIEHMGIDVDTVTAAVYANSLNRTADVEPDKVRRQLIRDFADDCRAMIRVAQNLNLQRAA